MVIRKNKVYLFIIIIAFVVIPWEYFSPGRFEDLLKYREYLTLNVRHEETLFNAPIIAPGKYSEWVLSARFS